MTGLSDQDIVLRLTSTEDSTVERKTASDYRDCLKTAVAFSNSLPVGDPGVIFVGVRNDGTVQDNNNLESLQKKVSEEIAKIYPPIYPQMKAMPDATGKEFLAIIVKGSEARPHFAGPSFVRDGTQTIQASKEQFERLVAQRSDKSGMILRWLGKEITFRLPKGQAVVIGPIVYMGNVRRPCWVAECNQFYVSLEFREGKRSALHSYPLAFVEITYDDKANRMELLGLPY
jgi:Schlafen, AlbA_2